MRAVVVRGPGHLAVEEVPYPELPPDGLILEIKACGICGGDLRTWQGGLRTGGAEWQILGHELNGIVAEVGSEVHDYQVGDRLAVAADVSCHDCYYCDRALYNLCENWKLLGAHYPGGMADYMRLPFDILRHGIVHRIPDGLEHIPAALAEPMSSVIASQHNINVDLGENVLIIGAGPIGCLHIEIAKARGAHPIIVELVEERLAYAESLGVKAAIKGGDDEQVLEQVRALTGGYGADVAITAAPSKYPQALAVRAVRKRGRVVLFGGLPKQNPITELDSNIIHYNELRIFGAFSYHPRFHQIALEMLADGQIQVDKIITNTYPIERALDAFEALKAGKEVKAVITPTA
jgi:L-iditol 2-dehydrogenase